MKKLITCALALCIILAMSVSAFAGEIDESGGSATTPVSLTTTNDGIGGSPSSVTPTKLSVTVPTSLPMAMSDNGDVVTATDCKIVNNSYGAVRVKTVTISAASGWNLTAFGPKSSLASEKVNSNKLGFAMRIGGGAQVKTMNSNASQQLISAPISGCYMSGAGDPLNNSVSIEYSAIITPLSGGVNGATVANVVFVVEWDAVA